MNKTWKQRNTCKNFNEYVTYATGRTIAQLVAENEKTYLCPGIDKVADALLEIRNAGKTVAGVFDFDADGICSTAEMHMLLSKLKIKHTLTVPKRLSEGYGISTAMVERLSGADVILTVDNGITANDAVAAAKNLGKQVIIMDHHNAVGDIPNADIIVDAEEFSEGWTFSHYCGAGLVYKLAEYMFPNETDWLDALSCFAAIATIGDVVDVTGDNRNIIRRGLDNINKRKCLPGLKALLDLISDNGKIDPFTVTDIAMKVVPAVNAPGRLEDNGGEQVLQCFFSKEATSVLAAQKICGINETRKQLVQEALDTLPAKGDNITFLYDTSLKEGICGIIAGRFSNEKHKPSYVMTKCADGTLKGSARCEEGSNVFESLKKCSNLLTNFGGHDCAAGFALKEENAEKLLEALEACTEPSKDGDTEYFDLEVAPADILPLFCEQNKIGIFGAGLKLPVIRMKAMVEDPKIIGQNKNTLSFKAANTKCIGFSLAEKYRELGSPSAVILYGTLDINWFRKRPSPQITLIDIEDAVGTEKSGSQEQREVNTIG